jgi:uncharacterized circularly permuted ATP-grasp superfamily protein
MEAGPAPYTPQGYDEAIAPDGKPRPAYQQLLDGLEVEELWHVSDRIREHFREHEIDFRNAGGSAEFHLDPVPRILTVAEWKQIEPGLRQRARALNAFVEDVYGERRIIEAGIVPERVVRTAERFEPEMLAVDVRGWRAPVIGFDVVRDEEGRFLVLEENMSTPSGLAYALAARTAVDAFTGLAPSRERRDAAVAIDLLRDVIAEAAPPGIEEPRAAVLTDGPSNSAWFEHRELAKLLGIPLVHCEDVFARDGRLYRRDDEGGEEGLDVVYRRTDEERLRDREGRPTWNARVLLEPFRQGNLAVINPFGASVADDKLSQAYVEPMIEFYLGEEPLLPSVRSYDLSDEETREQVLERLEEMVVKPRAESGGRGVMIEPDEREAKEVAAQVREHPEELIAQETVRLSTHPTLIDGALRPCHIDLRAFAIGNEIVPGGLTRVALDPESMIVNSSRNGGAKDTWVLS